MVKRVAVIWVVILLVISVQRLCSAEDLARLKADSIHFDKEADLVTAAGSVVITYKDLSIVADRVYIAVHDRQLVAKGNVEVRREDTTFTGDELTYDFKSERGMLQPIRLEIKGDEIDGVVLGEGRQMEFEGDRQIIHFGTLTTCDLDKPHYYFSAETLDYLPGDYIILRRVVYHEGKIPLFYWPYLYISLDEEENNFKMPTFGHDSYQGWYLYLGYNYFTKTWGKGEILLDFMEKLGIGYGVRHTYNWDKDSLVTAEVYRLENPSTGSNNDRIIFNYQDRFNEAWRLNTAVKWEEQAYVWSGREQYQSDNFEIDTKLSYVGEKISFTNNVHYWKRNENDNFYWSPSLQLTLFKTGRLNLNASWNENSDYYTASLSYYQSIHGYQLHTLMNRALDQRDELTISSPNFKFSWFPSVNWIFQANRIVPTPIYGQPEEEGTRLGLTVEGKSSAIYEKKDDFKLYYAWWAKERQYFTTAGDGNLFAINNSINLEKIFLPSLKGTVGLGWTQTWDNAPDFPNLMESIYNGGDFTYSLNYTLDKLSASFYGGYNLTNRLWNQQNASVNWRPTAKNTFTFSLGFNPEFDSGYSTTSWSYRPDDQRYVSVEHRLYRYAYAASSEQLNVNINFKQPLGENFDIHLVTRYDLLNDYINEARLTLAYKWHCRTIMVSYDYYRDTYLLQFKLNAFPDNQLTFNGDSGFIWDDFFKPWNQG